MLFPPSPPWPAPPQQRQMHSCLPGSGPMIPVVAEATQYVHGLHGLMWEQIPIQNSVMLLAEATQHVHGLHACVDMFLSSVVKC